MMEVLQTIISALLAVYCFASLFAKSTIHRFNVPGVNLGFFVGLLCEAYALYSGSWRHTIGGMMLQLAVSGFFIRSKGGRILTAFRDGLTGLGVAVWILSGSWIGFAIMVGMIGLSVHLVTISRKK